MIEDEDRPMPKSLRLWAQRAGFHMPKGYHRSWRRDGTFIAKSRKAAHVTGCREPRRFIRVLPHIDRIDICDGYFDRWANSTGASAPMPRNEQDFNATLARLLKESEPRVRETIEET